MANAWYTNGKLLMGNATIDWDDTSGGKLIKGLFLNNSYTYTSTHTTVSQLSANEVSGTGYTGGFAGASRKTLTTPTVSMNGTTLVYDAADLQWASAGPGWTPYSLQVFRQLSSDTTDADLKLIFHIDSGTGSDLFGVATNGSNLDLIWSASGILNIN